MPEVRRRRALMYSMPRVLLGLSNKAATPPRSRCRFLPGLGEGEAAFQMVGEQIGEARGCQHVGGLLQRLEVAAFAAEARTSTEPRASSRETAPKAKPSARTGTRGRAARGRYSHPAAQGRLHPVGLGQQGGFSPLDKMAAHDGDDVGGAAAVVRGAGAFDLMGVAVMEGVIFRHDSGNFQ